MQAPQEEVTRVTLKISDELLPNAPSLLRRIRGVLSLDFRFLVSGARTVDNYPIADYQTVFALKQAIVRDPNFLASHLEPSSLRVTQFVRDTAKYSPGRVIFRTPEGHVKVVRGNDEAIIRCKDLDGNLCFSVGRWPSDIGILWENYVLFKATHPWYYTLLLTITICLYVYITVRSVLP